MAFNFSVYHPHPGQAPRAYHHVARGQKYPLMFLDFSKNWYPEVKFYGEFKNLGPEISTYPHFPQLPTIISLPICHHIGKCGWLQILGYRFLNSPYNFTSRYQFLEKSNNIEGYFWPRALWWCARGCPGVPGGHMPGGLARGGVWYTEKLNATYK